MAESSNIHEVVGWLRQFVEGFNFTRPGKDQSLGRDILNVVVRGRNLDSLGGILGRCAEHKDPEGNEWAPNSSKPSRWHPKGYAGFKEDEYGIIDEPNRRTGQMLSQLTMTAKSTIGPTEIEIRPGTDQPPSSSAAPTGLLSEEDKKVTDTEKIIFAHTETPDKPARKFYGVNEEDRRNVIEVAQENLNDYIREVS